MGSPDPRVVALVIGGTRQSLDAAVKLLAAGASSCLKHAGVVGAESEVAGMLYASVVNIVKVVEANEKRKASGES